MSRCISKINPDLSIPELIKIAKHSFRECEFNEVQDILMQREKNMIIERERSERKCEELENRVLKLGLEVEELKRQKDELRLKMMESDELAQGYKSKFESLNPRMSNVEMTLANSLNVRVEDLPLLVNGIQNPASSHAHTLLVMSSEKGGIKTTVSSCLKEVGPNRARTSPGSQDNEGEKLQVSDDGANTAWTSPGSQDNEDEKLQVSGPHEHEATSLKMASSAPGDVIVISDSDDERDVAETTDVSDTYSGQMYKSNGRRKSDHEGGHFTKKMKQSMSLDNDALVKQHIPNTGVPQSTHPSTSTTPLEEINVLNGISTDSDDDESSYSDADMDNLVATIRSKTLPPP